VNWEVSEVSAEAEAILWQELPANVREALTGKLAGLWGAGSDELAFNGFAIDKQRALLIMVERLEIKRLWNQVKKIENVYGEGGVGIEFSAWPSIESTLKGRKDFTSFLANHKRAAGFYEKGRADAVLHFLYLEGEPRRWFVHFDLYSPVHSPASAIKHLRYELVGKLTPDWRMIQQRLNV
jgi:hypothetical protein